MQVHSRRVNTSKFSAAMPTKKRIQPTKWLPKDKNIIEKWLRKLLENFDKEPWKGKKEKLFKLHPPVKTSEEAKEELQPYVSKDEIKLLNFHKPVQSLYEKILTDPEINMFFHQMFWQQYEIPSASGDSLVPFWQIFILLLDLIMDYTPPYSDSELVGFPINVLINWPMATTAGFACFLNDKVNMHFREILDYWGKYLKSPASCSVLNEKEGGWFSPPALAKMSDPDGNSFETLFKCNPEEDHWGFTSWDDFFTREFNPRMRPLPDPDDPSIIVNACESAPFKIERNVNTRSLFWIKGQPYSLDHMLNNNGWAQYFHGGTVYQAFLSATSYHRWHSPISGTIIETELIPGSYYSQTYNIQDDSGAPNMSQGYITQVAARATIFIMADNPDIGILCFVSVGMSEVSSNEITVEKGQHINKGDQLGMFHFGGSTHCIIYRPELDVTFDLGEKEDGTPNTPGLDSVNIPLREKIATVKLVTKK